MLPTRAQNHAHFRGAPFPAAPLLSKNRICLRSLSIPRRPSMLPSKCWRALPCLRSLRPFSVASSPECRVASLEDVRAVLRLSGPGVLQFLQGLVTNDVLSLEAPGAPPLYACILNAQGRYLHDMIFYRTSDPEPTLYLDTDGRGRDDLLRLLKRYRLRQKIDIDDVSAQHSVWVQFGDAAAAAAPAGPSGPWQLDPRLPELGLRAILAKGAIQDPAAGSSAAASDWRDYRRWRIQQGVAEGDGEIPTGEVIPLEYNIDGLRGISFTKGCYVGQELMARTHFKGVVRKRVMPFRLRQPATGAAAQQGSDVYERDNDGRYKSVGKVRVVDGDLGLAILRLGKVMPAIEIGRPLYVSARGDGSYVELEVLRPAWWPANWGREEQQAAGGGGDD